MSVDVKYRSSATATGGRDGQASTADGSLNVKLSLPKELGGAGGPGNNPEQLFAAGLCRMLHRCHEGRRAHAEIAGSGGGRRPAPRGVRGGSALKRSLQMGRV